MPEKLTAEELANRLASVSGRDIEDLVLPLEALGVDSLDVIEWIYEIEDDYGVVLTDDETFFERVGRRSIKDIADGVLVAILEHGSQP